MGIANTGLVIKIIAIATVIRNLWPFSIKNGGHFEFQNGRPRRCPKKWNPPFLDSACKNYP